nr:4Fe-4S dicluster domain-containing protein [Adlercreutzia sp. JBNU-10]
MAAATAVGACVGGAGLAFAGPADVLRPPGGQDEAALIGACLKCDRCRSVCPTGVVSVAQVEDGLLRARTPVLNFHRGWCDFCGKCQQACPTGALGPFDPSRDKLGVAVVQPDRCLSYLQTCTDCRDSCGFGALSFNEGGHPVVDAAACNGCGRCELECTALVYGAFAGGTRRGIMVEPVAAVETEGSTL